MNNYYEISQASSEGSQLQHVCIRQTIAVLLLSIFICGLLLCAPLFTSGFKTTHGISGRSSQLSAIVAADLSPAQLLFKPIGMEPFQDISQDLTRRLLSFCKSQVTSPSVLSSWRRGETREQEARR